LLTCNIFFLVQKRPYQLVVTSNTTVTNNNTVDVISNVDPLTIHNIKVETLSGLNSSVSEKQTAIALEQAGQPAGNIIVTAELCDPSLVPITVQPIVQGPIVQPQVAVQTEQLTSVSTLSTEASSSTSAITLEPTAVHTINLPSITVQPISGDFVRPLTTESSHAQQTVTYGLSTNSSVEEEVPTKKARIQVLAPVHQPMQSNANVSIDLPDPTGLPIDNQSLESVLSEQIEAESNPIKSAEQTKSDSIDESLESTVKET
jgi:hypothetical protein